jgi:hypothetical protein
MKIHSLIVATLICLGAGLAHAESVSPPAVPGDDMRGAMQEKMRERCTADPVKCAEMKEKHQQAREEVKAACQKEPERCQEIRAEHRKKMQEERCAANPEQCEKMKARRAAMEKKCAADPQACEERKAKMRERMKERRMQQQTVPAAPAKESAPTQ